MNRPIVIVTIGMIIGILLGLYLNIGAIPIFLLASSGFIIFFILQKKVRIKFARYFRVFIKGNIIIIFICSITISFFYTLFRNSTYNSIEEKDEVTLTGEIQSSYTQNKHSYSYKIKIEDKLYMLYVKSKKTAKEFEYGDIVKLTGKIELPEISRNYNGFNQKNYYKSKNIYGNIYANNIKKINHKFSLESFANNIRNKIKNKIKNNLSNSNANILLGILIGDKNDIPDGQIEEFRDSSLIHILCVSRSTYRIYPIVVK